MAAAACGALKNAEPGCAAEQKSGEYSEAHSPGQSLTNVTYQCFWPRTDIETENPCPEIL